MGSARSPAMLDTASHGRVRFVIALSDNDEMRFQLLQAIVSEL